MMKDRATKYAHDIVSGKIFAGEEQKRACQRHLNDLERQNTEEFPFYWDVEEAERLIEFAETLQIAEGVSKKPLRAEGFQCFKFGSWNGWKTQDGFR